MKTFKLKEDYRSFKKGEIVTGKIHKGIQPGDYGYYSVYDPAVLIVTIGDKKIQIPMIKLKSASFTEKITSSKGLTNIIIGISAFFVGFQIWKNSKK